MLVLLGPPFEGTEEQYARLSRATGLLPYDLKMKCKPAAWGVVRALADPEQARGLCHALRTLGFPAAVVDSSGVGHDSERPIVTVRRIELEPERMILHLRERSMEVSYKALVAIVRGEVQLGRTGQGSGMGVSSAAFRAVNPSPTEVAVFREQVSSVPRDAFAALDLHFATVYWVARLDGRSFDFESPFDGEGPAQELDRLADVLAERGGVRVDRNIRTSSLASFTARHIKPSGAGGASASPPRSVPLGDEHFDAYSRLVAEAERQARWLATMP